MIRPAFAGTMSCFAALVATLVLTPAAPAQARVWQETFEAGSTSAVSVRTDEAHVRIRTRESGPVEVLVKHDLRTWGWVHGIRDPKVSIRRDAGVVIVEATAPGDLVVLGGVVFDFEITVTMPRQGRLFVESDDGRIECEPLRGEIRLEARDGSILATGLEGTVQLRTGDGRIEASALDGDVSARSADGRLELEGRFDRLDARSGDGSAQVTATEGSQLASPWSVETSDGSVSVRIPRDLAAMLDARTMDGRIVVDLPIRVPRGSRQQLTGQLNGGTQPLRVRTGDGRITLALSTP